MKVTGYRLLTFFVVASIAIAKAALAYQGHLTAPTTLDWVLGVVATLGYLSYLMFFVSINHFNATITACGG